MRRDVQRWRRNIGGNIGWSGAFPNITDKYTFFRQGGCCALYAALDLAVVKLICIAHLPPHIVKLNAWKDIFALQTPAYKPASCNLLTESHIHAEQEHIKRRQIEFLKMQHSISILFNGGALMSGDSIYTVHATTEDNWGTGLHRHLTHWGNDHRSCWKGELVLIFSILCILIHVLFEVVEPIGPEIFSTVSSDNMGNTHMAWEILVAQNPTLLNLQDLSHHINNTLKDITNLSYFKQVCLYHI